MSCTIEERMLAVRKLFQSLTQESSRLAKEALVRTFKKEQPEMADDLEYCFKVLAGRLKIGFKLNVSDACSGCGHKLGTDGMCYNMFCANYDPVGREYIPHLSIEDFTKPLFDMKDHSVESIDDIQESFRGYGWFLNPLFNREWKLGIGPSTLEHTNITPMLAKKYGQCVLPRSKKYFLTEKLDGNRCIASYNFQLKKWEFYSRTGKKLKVAFDMGNLPTQCNYDGEILSREQVANPSQENFNTLSGIINSIDGDKGELIYYIFDYVGDMPYEYRSEYLRGTAASLLGHTPNVRILPLLCSCTKEQLDENVKKYLDEIVNKGGEGVMINIGDAPYRHVRTSNLLKVKNVYTMDMRVLDIIPGTGKYEGMVGSLICTAVTQDGTTYQCNVGSGLSDYDRNYWMIHPNKIIDKIVEVAYFSLSQDANNRGSKLFSLRFPRFKRVREDKNTTSIF